MLYNSCPRFTDGTQDVPNSRNVPIHGWRNGIGNGSGGGVTPSRFANSSTVHVSVTCELVPRGNLSRGTLRQCRCLQLISSWFVSFRGSRDMGRECCAPLALPHHSDFTQCTFVVGKKCIFILFFFWACEKIPPAGALGEPPESDCCCNLIALIIQSRRRNAEPEIIISTWIPDSRIRMSITIQQDLVLMASPPLREVPSS